MPVVQDVAGLKQHELRYSCAISMFSRLCKMCSSLTCKQIEGLSGSLEENLDLTELTPLQFVNTCHAPMLPAGLHRLSQEWGGGFTQRPM